MRKFKKMTAMLLACALGTAMTGCANPAPKATEAPKTEAATTAPESAKDTEAAESKEETKAEASDIKYPTKPVQLILPAKPGGDIDMNGRLLAKDLGEELGQTVVPVTMDGGRGNEALQTLAEGAADGYQFVYFNSVLITSGVIGKMNYLYTDFKPVAVTSMSQANVCVVAADSKYNTLQDLIDDAKANPGTVRFPVTLGANSHFQAVAFEKQAGIKLKKLDASSGGDKAVGIISGQMDTFFTTYSPVKDYVESGKMKVLGVIGDERSDLLPDVPTFKESGIDMGDEFNQAYCLYANKDTPDEIVEIVQNAVKATMDDPKTVEAFGNVSFVPDVLIGAELDEYLKSNQDFYTTLKDDVMNDSF